MRRLVAAAAAVAVLGWVTAAVAVGADTFEVIDCTVSGEQVAGSKIVFPETRSGDWLVEIDRDGRTLTSDGRATGYAFARDGEPFRGYHLGALVLSGVGRGDCSTTTTGPEVTSTTAGESTTTTVPEVTTTTTGPEPVPTTTQPNRPNADGDCPAGATLDPTGVCFADAEGG